MLSLADTVFVVVGTITGAVGPDSSPSKITARQNQNRPQPVNQYCHSALEACMHCKAKRQQFASHRSAFWLPKHPRQNTTSPMRNLMAVFCASLALLFVAHTIQAWSPSRSSGHRSRGISPAFTRPAEESDRNPEVPSRLRQMEGIFFRGFIQSGPGHVHFHAVQRLAETPCKLGPVDKKGDPAFTRIAPTQPLPQTNHEKICLSD